MANQLFNYSSTYSSRYGSNATSADPYHYDSASIRYVSSPAEPTRLAALDRTGPSLFLSQNDSLRLRASEGARNGVAAGPAYSWGVMDGYGGALPASESISAPGIKRNADAFYHQNILGTHNAIGQTEALFSTNPLVKRPRFETASHLPIYPQRPGEKDCAHYMFTRTCKFGESCKFDHPTWVPEGGIPDWKEQPQAPAAELLPERPGEPDCTYFMKHKKCKFGNSCKFNHPKDESTEFANATALPERPSEPVCSFYAKTGKCKFGSKCIYHHPKDIQIPLGGQDPGSGEKKDFIASDNAASALQKESAIFTPALLHNSKGLPIRPGEQDCTFYMKTGSCKFGATCCYNHPDRSSLNPVAATPLAHATFNPAGVINPGLSFIPNIEIRLNQQTLGVGSVMYPQRPGESECDFYLKTGHCKFGERCKFHHPIDRSGLATTKQASRQNVKLTLAGLPRREGSIMCPFYMKTGTCKFGATCKYDHPPPGEVIAKAAIQGSGNAADDESGEMENATETSL